MNDQGIFLWTPPPYRVGWLEKKRWLGPGGGGFQQVLSNRLLVNSASIHNCQFASIHDCLQNYFFALCRHSCVCCCSPLHNASTSQRGLQLDQIRREKNYVLCTLILTVVCPHWPGSPWEGCGLSPSKCAMVPVDGLGTDAAQMDQEQGLI